jgi:hypothetical protein
MKKLLLALALVCLFPFSAMADSVSVAPTSVVVAFGGTFISSPSDSIGTGFSKATVFLYRVSENLSFGATIASVDFNATNITATDLEQYGAVAIYHDKFSSTSKLGWFLKGRLGLDQLNGGPFDFATLIGVGGFYNINDRFCLVGGVDPAIIDYKTRTFGATVYAGIETNIR